MVGFLDLFSSRKLDEIFHKGLDIEEYHRECNNCPSMRTLVPRSKDHSTTVNGSLALTQIRWIAETGW